MEKKFVPSSRGQLFGGPSIKKTSRPSHKVHKNIRTPLATYISKEGLINIAWGFGVSASGGGGSFVDGINLAYTMISEGFTGLQTRSIYDAPAQEMSAISGGMGAPSAIAGGLIGFIPSCKAALETLNELGQLPYPITGITPIEAGPVNGLLPIYLSFKFDYNLYDCDGAGRAVPSLTNLLFDYENIRFSPAGVSDIDAVTTEIHDEWDDGAAAEDGLRDVIITYGGAIGLAAWPQNGTQLQASELNVGTYGTADRLGAAIQEVKSNGLLLEAYFVIEAVNEKFRQLIWRAKLDYVYSDPDALEQGYDKGYLVFGRDTIELGYEYRLYFLNENLFISKHSVEGTFIEYVTTAPSTIAAFFSDPTPPDVLQAAADDFIPYNTGDMKYIQNLVGKEILVVVTPPAEKLYQQDVEYSFVDVLNSYFNDYDFNFTLNDIYPASID